MSASCGSQRRQPHLGVVLDHSEDSKASEPVQAGPAWLPVALAITSDKTLGG